MKAIPIIGGSRDGTLEWMLDGCMPMARVRVDVVDPMPLHLTMDDSGSSVLPDHRFHTEEYVLERIAGSERVDDGRPRRLFLFYRLSSLSVDEALALRLGEDQT